jgi:predicted DNA-binding transcriptional regulator AlpA
MAQKLADQLSYPPRAMRLETAAAYLSISPSSFLRMVEVGDLPPATKKGGIALWDRLDLDASFQDWKDAQASENTAHRILRERQHERRRSTRLSQSENS